MRQNAATIWRAELANLIPVSTCEPKFEANLAPYVAHGVFVQPGRPFNHCRMPCQKAQEFTEGVEIPQEFTEGVEIPGKMPTFSLRGVEIPGQNTNFFFACNFLFDRFKKYRMGTGGDRR